MSGSQNTPKPKFMHKKRCNSICQHAVKGFVAMTVSLHGYIVSWETMASTLMKVIYGIDTYSVQSHVIFTMTS